MRFLICLLLTLLPLSAEYVGLMAPKRTVTNKYPAESPRVITLSEGEVATVLYLTPGACLDVHREYTVVRITPKTKERRNLPVIVGPAVIQLIHNDTKNAALASISILRADDTALSAPQN